MLRRDRPGTPFQLIDRVRLSSHAWQRFSEASDGSVWMADFETGFRPAEMEDPAPPTELRGWGAWLLHDRRGTLWVATRGQGLWRGRGPSGRDEFDVIAIKNGLASDAVQCLFEDREGKSADGTAATRGTRAAVRRRPAVPDQPPRHGVLHVVSSAFSYRAGVQINANYQVAIEDLTFQPGANRPVANALSGVTNTFVTQNLVSNDTFGEGIRIVDFKLSKNLRFRGTRLNIGADVFNVFNSDAALGYCSTYPNPAQGIEGCVVDGIVVDWRTITNITTPRYARFQLQFDF